MAASSESTETRIARLERRAFWIRSGAIAWGAWTVVTFGYVGIAQPANYSADEGWPIYLGGAVLTLLFLAAIIWPPWRDVSEWIDRVATLLQWQVAAGAVIAFSIAVGSRPELLVPFGTYGVYLLLFAGPAMAMRIVEGSLRRRYRERDEGRERVRRAAEIRSLVESVRAEARVSRLRFWHRR